MIETTTQEVRIGRYMPMFGLLALIALIVTGVIAAQPGQLTTTLHSYVFAVIMFTSLTLGCFGLTLLQHVLQGKWGLPILRIFEAGGGVRNFALLILLFIPIFLFANHIYAWAQPESVARDVILQHRAPYSNWPFILIRFFFIIGACMLYANFLRRSVKVQEATGRFREQQKRTNWASPGLVFLVLSVTFFYTDWVMTLDPHWWSTMYALWFISGMALGATSLAAVITCVNAHRAPYNSIVNKAWTRDIGNLMLTFTMLWGYTNLSQYLIIWHGNLPETTTYLVNRSIGHWSTLSFVLVVGQFFVPFFGLLSPSLKATPWKLATLASWVLFMRVLDHFYVVEPFFRPNMAVTLTDLLAFIGVGCAWAFVFSWNAKRMPLLPTYDPRILEVEHAH